MKPVTPAGRVFAALGAEWLTVRELMAWTGESRAQVDNAIQRGIRHGRVESESPRVGGRRLGAVAQRYRAVGAVRRSA